MEKSLPWSQLLEHYNKNIKSLHLKDLLTQENRNAQLKIELENILFDYSHEKLDANTLKLLDEFVQSSKLWNKVEDMFSGKKINKTEDRAVLHVALRAKKDQVITVDGENVVPQIHHILDRISDFSTQVRDGKLKGFTGKNLTNVLVIGIGGSYLGIEFAYEAMRCHKTCAKASEGRVLKFLANVDPNDFYRATQGIDPETTLVVINSKTFTTAETMLNARTVRNWILDHYRKAGQKIDGPEAEGNIVNHHMCAVSTNLKDTKKFGISDERVFGFWDWVGGRYSLCSAVGVLPLSLHFGFDIMREFLDGANFIDNHFFKTRETTKNIPLMLGLIGFYTVSIQGYNSKAILPYAQPLNKFAPHIQQVDMESNGKRVSVDGKELDYECGVINFGEPGTNGQHSFYQLIHQGRVIPCEFIGFCKSQTPVDIAGEPVTNHDELMSNFFSQPDALAFGKSVSDLQKEKVPESLWTHKTFPGNRPSCQFLFEELTPFATGQLLAIYEHRTAVEGFLWDVNSFDQWGVELGKALAKEVRNFLKDNKQAPSNPSFDGYKFNSATSSLLKHYCQKK